VPTVEVILYFNEVFIRTRYKAKCSLPYWRYYFSIHLEGLRKTTTITSRSNRFHDGDSNKVLVDLILVLCNDAFQLHRVWRGMVC